jgi:hypothetical protein
VNSIVIVIRTIKKKFILMFLCCKKIIHIFFDLYEGMWRNQKLVILSLLGIIKLSIKFLVEKNNIYFLTMVRF